MRSWIFFIKWYRFEISSIFCFIFLSFPLNLKTLLTLESVSIDSIFDGDTFIVSHRKAQIILRLACVDTPEMDQVSEHYILTGKMAFEFVQRTLAGDKSLQVFITGVDRYQRWVGDLWVNGKNLGLLLLEKGLAIPSTHCTYQNLDQFDQILAAFWLGHGQGHGLYSFGCSFSPPVHRQKKKRQQ
jgi:endonuclease YncB( thermonuclease family)